MEKENVVLKNTSRGTYYLDLTEITKNKVLTVGIDKNVMLTPNEYEWIATSYPQLFEKGMFEIVKAPNDVEKVESKNIYTADEIEKMMLLTKAKFKTAVNKIEVLEVLRDVRSAAIQAGKPVDFMNIIDNRIAEFDEESVLI